MKHLFILFIFFVSLSIKGQETQWQDFATFEYNCDNQIIELNDTNFAYSAVFGANVAGDNVYGQIQRTVTYQFTDFDDHELKTISYTSTLGEYNIFELNSSHLAGLPGNTTILVNMIICYEYVNDEAGDIHNLTLFANQEENCSGSFENLGDQFCCEINQIICFFTPPCEDINVAIDVLIGSLAMEANVSKGNSTDYTYQWTYEDADTGEISNIGNTQTIDFDPCADGDYCVTVTEISTGCTYTDCVPFFSQFDCMPCMLPDAITGLSHSSPFPGVFNLSWDPVPNAAEYTVFVRYNDPFCCPGNEGQVAVDVFSTSPPVTEVTVNHAPKGGGPSCFSWIVVANCDGNGSVSSDKQCVYEYINIKARSENENNISLYPNPTSSTSKLTIENVIDQEVAINVYSLEGKLVSDYRYTLELGQNTLQAEIGQNLESGIYMIQVNSENLNLTKKIVIQK